ncbi:enoyl-CoA hydratase-related protein [Bdellovibrionota bacterium FG-1]
MRILLLTHSFNSLAQRLYLELTRRGHELSIEFDIHDEMTEQAVSLFQPALIIAPYLKRAIPASVWTKIPCFIIHPGIRGDRGPSSLDWAILNQELQWGVTVLQANAEMDAGDIWAEEIFAMRRTRKSSLYRHEVTTAAVKAILTAIDRFSSKTYRPEPLNYNDPNVRGKPRPPMTQADRKIHWEQDTTQDVLRKLNSADGSPGVLDTLLGRNVFLFNGMPAQNLKYFEPKSPGAVLGWSPRGVLIATTDGAVWITHLKEKASPENPLPLKLPAHQVLHSSLTPLPQIQGPRQISFTQKDLVGILEFEFYNGAMSTEQCVDLRNAIIDALKTDIRVLVLFGSEDFWSNGIHLHSIESSKSPADESWHNVQAMNDLAETILTATHVITVSALQGNAGAGGVFLALASDFVFARPGIVLNPHYKSMGNLYGSEYWTYSLPRRVGNKNAHVIMEAQLPLDTLAAMQLGLIDAHFGDSHHAFRQETLKRAQTFSQDPEFTNKIENKNISQREDFEKKPLAAFRAHEMEQMNLNFYGFDPSYHIARYHFVHRIQHSRTPKHLAKHRDISSTVTGLASEILAEPSEQSHLPRT